MIKIFLVDDGTLDTVFECEICSEQIRYSEFARDMVDGSPLAEAMDDADAEHAAECEGPSDASLAFSSLARDYHGGQWTDLYAYASSGTVACGLALEIFSCILIAQRNNAHEKEILALKEFHTWAELAEQKLPQTEG